MLCHRTLCECAVCLLTKRPGGSTSIQKISRRDLLILEKNLDAMLYSCISQDNPTKITPDSQWLDTVSVYSFFHVTSKGDPWLDSTR